MISLNQAFLGVRLLKSKLLEDDRGDFVKTFLLSVFAELGIAFTPVDEFFSTSRKRVLRGMHFQLPPHEHAKLVYCIQGRVLDGLLDLRKNSPTFGKYTSAELSRENHPQLYTAERNTQGSLAVEDDSVTVSKIFNGYAVTFGPGRHWSTFDVICLLRELTALAARSNSQSISRDFSPVLIDNGGAQ